MPSPDKGKNLNKQIGNLIESSLVSPISWTSTDSKSSKNPEKPKKHQNDPQNALKDLISVAFAEIPSEKTTAKQIAQPKQPEPSDPITPMPADTSTNPELGPHHAAQPATDRNPIYNHMEGTVDGKAYFQLVQWFTNGRKFTQTAWNKKYKIRGNVAQMNFLIRKLATNIQFIENGFLVDISEDPSSERHKLIDIQGGKIVFVNQVFATWQKKNKLNIEPLLNIIRNQFKQPTS